MKYRITKELDFLAGYLRYGHLEGKIEAKSLEEAKKKVKELEESGELLEHIFPVVDDWDIEDWEDNDYPVEIEEIGPEKEVAQEVELVAHGEWDGKDVYEAYCPRCSYEFDDCTPKYCCKCGQKINWEGVIEE